MSSFLNGFVCICEPNRSQVFLNELKMSKLLWAQFLKVKLNLK